MTASGFAMSESAYSWQMQPEVQQLRAEGRGPSFGAWCTILHCRINILRRSRDPDWSPEQSDTVHWWIDSRLDAHGEPPAPFIRCWVLDKVDIYQFFARKGRDQGIRDHANGWLDALRALWRRYVPEEGKSHG